MPALETFPVRIQSALIAVYKRSIRFGVLRRVIHVIHPELGSIAAFVHATSRRLPPGARVLDAGAGSQMYREFFREQEYRTIDFYGVEKAYAGEKDYVGDLNESLPIDSTSFDAVLSTSVLEHLREPERFLTESLRILKPGGVLFLTAPQGWGLHDEPHHYFNFTRYGLELLLRRAGYEIESIRERGGFFRYLAQRLQEIPIVLLRAARTPWLFPVAVPLALLSIPVVFLATPPVLTVMDVLFDRERRFTLGYACVALRPKAG